MTEHMNSLAIEMFADTAADYAKQMRDCEFRIKFYTEEIELAEHGVEVESIRAESVKDIAFYEDKLAELGQHKQFIWNSFHAYLREGLPE